MCCAIWNEEDNNNVICHALGMKNDPTVDVKNAKKMVFTVWTFVKQIA